MCNVLISPVNLLAAFTELTVVGSAWHYCRVHRGASPGVLRRRRAVQLQHRGGLWFTGRHHRLRRPVQVCALGRRPLDRGRLQVHRQRLAEWPLRLPIHPRLGAIDQCKSCFANQQYYSSKCAWVYCCTYIDRSAYN